MARSKLFSLVIHYPSLQTSTPTYRISVFPMNISGTLNVFRLIREPALCLPQHTVSTFNHLPVPLSKAFPKRDGEKEVDIKAVVLDKDNCFAVPHTNEVYKPYHVRRSLLYEFSIVITRSTMLNTCRINSKNSAVPTPAPNSS